MKYLTNSLICDFIGSTSNISIVSQKFLSFLSNSPVLLNSINASAFLISYAFVPSGFVWSLSSYSFIFQSLPAKKIRRPVNKISPPSVNFLYEFDSSKCCGWTLLIEFLALTISGRTFSFSASQMANVAVHSSSNFLAFASSSWAVAFFFSASSFFTVSTLTNFSVSSVAFFNKGLCFSICSCILPTSTFALLSTVKPLSNLFILLLNSFVLA